MDLYVDKHFKSFIIDFNPFHEITDSILFNWSDICHKISNTSNNNDIPIELKYNNSSNNNKIQYNDKSQYRYPIDCVDLTDEHKIQEFINSQQKTIQ